MDARYPVWSIPVFVNCRSCHLAQDTGLFGFYGESDEATLDSYFDELLFAVLSSEAETVS